jgi:hypothetical protein
LNQLTDDQRKELRKREYLTCTRINKSSSPPSQPAIPPPSIEKVVPPPPPPVHELLPKPAPTYDIQLNIDVTSMFGKLNMIVPMIEMCNIPYVRRVILKLLQVLTEKEDPLIILNTMYLNQKKGQKSSFIYFSRHEWPLLEQLYARLWGLYRCHVIEGNGTSWFEDNLTLWKLMWH